MNVINVWKREMPDDPYIAFCVTLSPNSILPGMGRLLCIILETLFN